MRRWGVTLGPVLCLIIGGLLSHFLEWRLIIWLLTIFAGSMLLLLIFVFPETSRSVVGNGTVPPQKWNIFGLDLIRRWRLRRVKVSVQVETITQLKRRPTPLDALKIVFDKDAGTILFYEALLYAGFFSILSSCRLSRKKI